MRTLSLDSSTILFDTSASFCTASITLSEGGNSPGNRARTGYLVMAARWETWEEEGMGSLSDPDAHTTTD